jgi:hypothetical protein
MLALTSHNGFPVVSDDGHLKGFILRKTLCGLLKLKAFSSPAASHSRVVKALGGEVEMKRRKGKSQSEQDKDSEVRSPDSTATQDDNDSSAENMEEEDEEEETKDDKEVDERELDGDMITLTAGATVFHQTLEKNYPLYPSIKEIDLTPSELVSYIAVRSPHSTAAFSP